METHYSIDIYAYLTVDLRNILCFNNQVSWMAKYFIENLRNQGVMHHAGNGGNKA